jgi:tetratricopeptide (TPR) repeat protein
MSRNLRFAMSMALAMTVAIAANVLASGGGGGSSAPSMPSVSTPQYDPAVEFKNGLDAMKASRFKDAQRAFDHVLAVDSRHVQANFMAGFSRASQGNDKAANRYYEKAVKYDPNFILAHRELALSHLRLDDRQRTTAILADLKQRATACADTCPQAADLKAAISALEAALAPSAAPPAADGKSTGQFVPSPKLGDRAYVQAVALINEHRYGDAIARLHEASLAFGPHPDILTYLGFANRKLGRLDVAEGYYREALAVAPRHVGATEYYGELMVERGDLVGARRMLVKLEGYCDFGCAEVDELRRWIVAAQSRS